MLSINTNLSSFIAQRSMKQSTNKLNQAIERMTTGYKLNHASDNAANYSIATNMSTQLNAYNVAADNVAMGMDLVTTASDIVSQMQDKGERLRALAIQARNGTYGAQSLSAVNAEAQSIMSEINRIYMNAEYNGIKFFDLANTAVAAQASEPAMTYSMRRAAQTKPEAKAEYNGFIENPVSYTQTQINNMASIDSFTSGASGEFKIEDAEDLAKLGEIAGQDISNAIFVLANDIDLSAWQNQYGDWVPIGNDSNVFTGVFDGNGHVVKNMTITGSDEFVGLFGRVENGEIKNLGVVDANIEGDSNLGIIVGVSIGTTLENCYTTGKVGNDNSVTVGGLIGVHESGEITNCYSIADVSGRGMSSYGTLYGIGGLVGIAADSNISNSYATGSVSAEVGAGGLVSMGVNTTITNCYATGNVEAQKSAGGLVVVCLETTISDSYATGNVEAQEGAGGLVSFGMDTTISNSYATGNVCGQWGVGGLVGDARRINISNSYAIGDITGGEYVGGLAGSIAEQSEIISSYATGDVSGQMNVGGLVGEFYTSSFSTLIADSYAYGTVTGDDFTGSLIGCLVDISNFSITNCQTVMQACDPIGAFLDGSYNPIVTDMTPLLENITVLAERPTLGGGTTGAVGSGGGCLSLQVGIYGDESCSITLNTGFSYDLSVLAGGIESDVALQAIDDFINTLSEKATHYGAVLNRLESALDSIEVNIANLASSRSTIHDADIAKVSAEYIQQQILQQASATLLATANQSAGIALQLI